MCTFLLFIISKRARNLMQDILWSDALIKNVLCADDAIGNVFLDKIAAVQRSTLCLVFKILRKPALRASVLVLRRKREKHYSSRLHLRSTIPANPVNRHYHVHRHYQIMWFLTRSPIASSAFSRFRTSSSSTSSSSLNETYRSFLTTQSQSVTELTLD